jgi:Domain of unknown function (DUF1893)
LPADLYKDFLASDDTLRIYTCGMLAFTSKKDRLRPLLDYLAAYGAICQTVIIYDKVIGNAAALLAVKANASEVYSPLGSELAVKTLEERGVKYHFEKTVPYIIRDDGKGMCPMEELSLGKTPGEFYKVMKARINKKQ